MWRSPRCYEVGSPNLLSAEIMIFQCYPRTTWVIYMCHSDRPTEEHLIVHVQCKSTQSLPQCAAQHTLVGWAASLAIEYGALDMINYGMCCCPGRTSLMDMATHSACHMCCRPSGEQETPWWSAQTCKLTEHQQLRLPYPPVGFSIESCFTIGASLKITDICLGMHSLLENAMHVKSSTNL